MSDLATRTSANEPAAVNRGRSDNRRLTTLVGVRMTVEDHVRYKAAAKAHNMTVPEFLRACADYLLAIDERERRP